MTTQSWITICTFDALLPNTGVCALVNDEQVAVFRVGDALYAIHNFDPIGEANVLSRGIIGSVGDVTVVASPLYKEHYNLATGACLEKPDVSVKTYDVRVLDQVVQIRAA
jgi:nitrite reductase (NADH) small subunit